MAPVLDDPTWTSAWDELVWQDLMQAERSLLDADPDHLSPDGVIDLLIEVQREQSRLAAIEARALAVAAGPFERRREVPIVDRLTDEEHSITVADEAREEISAALHRSPGVVHEQICGARLLVTTLPGTHEALASGCISPAQARVITDQARRLSGAALHLFDDPAADTPAQARERTDFLAACARLESKAIAWASIHTPGQLRNRLRRLVATIDTEGQERRRREARRDIGVELVPEDDGLALLLARLPIEQAARVHAALDAAARSAAGSAHSDATHPTVGQRRAEALVDAVCGAGRSADVTTEVQVVITLDALLGIDDAPATITLGDRQPEPVSAHAVRDLIADPDCPSTLRRLVIDPITGHLLDRGRRSYAVSDAMRAFLALRDRTCRFPGCSRAARRCQIDHAVAWDDGGGTDRANLGPLCTRHHQLKTHGGWDIADVDADGTVMWRTPMGRRYRVRPPTLAPEPPAD